MHAPHSISKNGSPNHAQYICGLQNTTQDLKKICSFLCSTIWTNWSIPRHHRNEETTYDLSFNRVPFSGSEDDPTSLCRSTTDTTSGCPVLDSSDFDDWILLSFFLVIFPPLSLLLDQQGTMKLYLPLLLVASASAFAPAVPQRRAFGVRPLFMSEEPETGGALVPIKEETVEFTAGIIGGVVGYVVGGPLLGVIGAATANYVCKSDGDASEIVAAVSKSSIQVYNYLASLDSKYEVLNKAKASLEEALNKLKSNGSIEPESIKKVEAALSSTQAKISEINDEYDLVGAGVTALGVVGDLVEKAIKKAGEINEEYMLTSKAMEALGGAVAKAKSSVNSSS